MPGTSRLGSVEPRNRFYSTAELAAAAGVTPRTVRFYETRGLLKPDRAGSVRVFTYSDRARLQLILRGKRLGFSLDEIGDYLDLYGADADHQEQLSLVIDKSRERIAVLEGKLKDLQATIKELRHIEHEAVARLRAKQGHRAAAIQPFPKTRNTREGRPS
jgi:DNA-binding transcriptional MerR regulator